MYGYGGFNISLPPGFSASKLIWVKHFGGAYVQANLRGGGEFGRKWHQSGTKERKQNVFDDFAAVLRHVAAQRISAPERIAIQGGSNGGLLVAATWNQVPKLFACALCHVGVLDMLRFQRYTIGYAWVSDYGSAENKDDFPYLFKYSPLHNVPERDDMPALLVLTSDHDDRVSPIHSFKFIAQVQHTIGARNTAPLLMRVERKGGHGAGLPLAKQLQAATDAMQFAAIALKANFSEQ